MSFGWGCGSEERGKYYGTVDRMAGRDATTLYINNHSEPEYLDPSLNAETAGAALIRGMNEGLVGIHPEHVRPVAGVANRWAKSADNKHYRFHLREDARWSDGVPVVASHFVDAWRRVLEPKTGARMATNMYVIAGGAGFHQRRLLALKADAEMAPLDGPAKVKLKKGTAVKVLKRLPATAVREPFARGGSASVTVEAPAKDAPPTELVKVVGVGKAVKCNGEDDRWYRVEAMGKQGWLPGCAIVEGKKTTSAVVEEHPRPTFSPAGEATGDDEVKPNVGLLELDALEPDPTVIGVRAVGDHVLEVQLSRPTAYFLELCQTTTYFPVRMDVIAEHGERWTRPENIVTNGAFTLAEHRFRYEMVFEKNPKFWDADKMKVDRIVWMAVQDNFSTLNLYKTGEIDWTGENVSLPPAFIGLLKGYDDYHPARWIGTYWYEFNVDKPPVDDPLVRRALNVAVDKKLLVDKVTRGGQIPAQHLVPPYTGSGYAEVHEADVKAGKNPFSGKGYEFDPAYGRELLAQAGYEVNKTADGYKTEGFPSLEVLYNSSESHRKIAVAIQGMWREHLGITVQVRNEEWKVMIKSIRDGNFQIARFGWIGDYNHPHTWLDTWLSYSNNNWTRWKSPEYDALINQAAQTGEPEESIRIYRKAEKLAMDGGARLPLYFYTKLTMMKPYLKGNWPNPTNKHPVKWMWIDPDWRKRPENTTAYPVEELPPAEAY